MKRLKSINGVIEVVERQLHNSTNHSIGIITNESQSVYEIIETLRNFQLTIIDIKTETPSLEDVFLEKTGRTLEEDTSKTIRGNN